MKTKSGRNVSFFYLLKTNKQTKNTGPCLDYLHVLLYLSQLTWHLDHSGMHTRTLAWLHLIESSYRPELHKYLFIHTLVQKQLPHFTDDIFNNRPVKFRLGGWGCRVMVNYRMQNTQGKLNKE